MAEAYIGEIRIFTYTFAPMDWADCNGQIMAIQQNTALFSLLGVNYGGNGSTTFGLPDFRDRMPIHAGTGPGLTPRNIGNNGGEAQVTLLLNQMPAHQHNVPCSTDTATESDPTNKVPAVQRSGRDPVNQYNAQANALMTPGSIAGGGQPHENRPPYQVLRFCICMSGVYPSRN